MEFTLLRVLTLLVLSSQLCLCSPGIKLEHLEKLIRHKRSDNETIELRNLIGQLARQSVLHQLFIEEQVRSGADTGIKQVRHVREGTKPYHSDNYIGWAFASNHDHEDYIRTVGLGEVTVNMNGVEFRTRHNDYSITQASPWSHDWQDTYDFPFPWVPWFVDQETTLEGQIKMMRNFFRAWRDQDNSTYDYQSFFKPVLCYMEGMWTVPDEDVDESFDSDRHYLDASTWYELEEKIRFLSYTGSKDPDENLAYLPKIIINVTEDGYPVYAQWNYDILCHPLSRDLPLNRFRVVDDLSARMRYNQGLENYEKSNLARFTLNVKDEPFETDSHNRMALLDSLMYEIPGKDNYDRYLEDYGLGEDLYMHIENNTQPLNTACYHRAYTTNSWDAMGSQNRYRGFSDVPLYFAQNTQPKIHPMSFTSCDEEGENCKTVEQRFSWAIPLEIIYLTPLTNWNPFNLTYKGDDWSNPEYGSVTEDGRNGQQGNAYNGTNGRRFYQTPFEFFNATDENGDTSTDPMQPVYVLDKQGNERMTVATGHRISFPYIPGVGTLRQRYPIAPVYGDGSAVMKELLALKELVMNPNTLKYMIHDPYDCNCGSGGGGEATEPPTYAYRTTQSDAEFDSHVHEFMLDEGEVADLTGMKNVTVITSQGDGHTHTLLIYAVEGSMNALKYHLCDNNPYCWDGHSRDLVRK